MTHLPRAAVLILLAALPGRLRSVLLREHWLTRAVLTGCLALSVWQLARATSWPWILLHGVGALALFAENVLASWFSGTVHAADERLLNAYKERIDSSDKYIRVLERQLVSSIETSYKVASIARVNERAASLAEERARQSRRDALDCAYEAERWKAVAEENAVEGVRMARVLTTQIAQVAGEQELQRSPQLLADSERKN